MYRIEQISINGEFVTPHGSDVADLISPATQELIGQVRLAGVEDTHLAIDAAQRAFPGWSRTTKDERIAVLERMHAALSACEDELMDAIVLEYGAPIGRSRWMAQGPAEVVADTIRTLSSFEFIEQAGIAKVVHQPAGVAGLITPWNANALFIVTKLATALAAGCTAVLKPSELSALQTQVVTKALHAAELPAGVFNIVTGSGSVVGAELARNPAIAKISFTGSTAVGKQLLIAGADSIKRITLELGGKSPTVILDDANFATAVPMALAAGFLNSGQACIAGTRLLAPRSRLGDFEALVQQQVLATKAGDPRDTETAIGPMVSEKQWERVQGYIRLGLEEGASLLAGGPGRPDGCARGWFVRPTVFTQVRNDMRIAQEEIFGPVLCIIPYGSDDEAVRLANDTRYGLSAMVLGANSERAMAIARKIETGRVQVNTLAHEPQAPFGGVKQSGLGREMGKWGLRAFLEPKTILVGA